MCLSLSVSLLHSSFYRKRLPQQNGDRRIGERGTCMRLIVCGSKVGLAPSPPPTRDKEAGLVYYNCPPPS